MLNLFLKEKIFKIGNKELEEEDQVTMKGSALHSLWKEVKILLFLKKPVHYLKNFLDESGV